MIIIVWSDHDGTHIEKFGEGVDGQPLAEAKVLELHNLVESSDSYGTIIDMIIRGTQVQYEIEEVASKVKIKSKF